jgi:hypothetical protein
VTRAAVWLRVSTSHQDADSQLPDLERFCAAHGMEIVRRFPSRVGTALSGSSVAHLKLPGQVCLLLDVIRGWAN